MLAEGCDLVLHCNGEMDEMIPIAEGCPGIAAEAEQRLSRALSALGRPALLPFDRGQAQARLAELLAIPTH